MNKLQTALIVLDGWGYRQETEHNAVHAAKTPIFGKMWNTYPHSLLQASGLDVGLPEVQMGNSEIGHTTIGAGTVIDTDLVRIDKAVTTNTLASMPALQELLDLVKSQNSTLHLMGLLSSGGVHSHQSHLYAILRAAKDAGISRIAIHAFTDGRDTAPQSAAAYLSELEAVIAEVGAGSIATVTGRYYAMDRDNNWDRLAKFESALLQAEGAKHTQNPSHVVQDLYAAGKFDEHLEPLVFADAENNEWKLEQHDGVFIFNFRSDRGRMLLNKLTEHAQNLDVHLLTMTQYSSKQTAPMVFAPNTIVTTLAAQISQAGLTQLHVAETEKFPHATYFLNGGREEPHPGEEHILLDSRKDVATHDMAPKMRAEAIADAAISRIKAGVDFTFINFANPDMVGHTGNAQAIVEAVEEVDTQLGRVLDALLENQGVALVTADHGNAELNVEPSTGNKHTSHTLNPVPCILVGGSGILSDGSLADLAPTVLQLLSLPKPAAMTGSSLIQ